MAAAGVGFNAEEFRTGIRTAMLLGLPEDVSRRPEFVIESTTVPGPGTADADGVPWDPTVSAPADAVTRVRPTCVVDTTGQALQQNAFGPLEPGTAIVTVLDEEYAQIKGFAYMNLWLAGQDTPARYYYTRVLEQPNLDIVGVWVIECRTRDEV